jgi:hypothetical protein
MQSATRPRNDRTAGVFKSALDLGLIHSPAHDLARLELQHLQQYPNGKVDHPTYGPIQTADVADALFEVTEQCLGQNFDVGLGNLRLHGSQPGGLAAPPTNQAAAPDAAGPPQATDFNFPSPSVFRRPPRRYMPARGRHWR